MKNLLLTIALATLTIQTEIGTRNIFILSEPTTKTNIFENTTTENNTLINATQVATINFDEQIKTNLTYRQRAIITTNRDIDANEYTINVRLFVAIDTTLDRTEQPTTFDIVLNAPLMNNIQSSEVIAYYYNSLTPLQNNFLNGTNYTSYNQMQTIDLGLTINQREITRDSDFGDLISIETSEYSYISFDIILEYNANNIVNSGTDLLNNINTISRTTTDLQYRYEYDTSTYEVIDIPGLMFEVLGMPLAWLSMAFNFTIFEGTPYAINISSILMSLLVALIGIIIFRIVMKGR